MMDLSKYSLIIFDLDGTLAERDSGNLLPRVSAWFNQNGEKFDFAIATNQGGVGLRYWMEQDGFGEPEKYPTEDAIWKRIHQVLGQLHDATFHEQETRPSAANVKALKLQTYVCFAYQSRKGIWSPTPPDELRFNETMHANYWRQDWRKPQPGMLLEAMGYSGWEQSKTLMVGDSPEDQQAAQNAGCDFRWAWDFFGREKPE